jgi:hypothetical protein
MNANNPDAKPVGLDPITYHVEEYEPSGMEGIFIVDAYLDIQIDYSENEPYIESISFDADRKSNCMIPSAFKSALIKIMQADTKLMEYIGEACAEEYSYNN